MELLCGVKTCEEFDFPLSQILPRLALSAKALLEGGDENPIHQHFEHGVEELKDTQKTYS
jgi:hypothetical protein